MSSNKDLYILGISAFYHDSAAALIKNGEIVAAAQEERFTRIKQDSTFPVNAIKFCLEFEGINISEVNSFVFYDKPFKKFERILETYYIFAPRGLRSFLSAATVWIKEKLFLKELIRDELKKLSDDELPGLLFSEHHLSHAASAFYPSPFEKAAILTIDGVGEWATASIAYGEGNSVKTLKEMKFPNSLGFLYSAFTYFLGFKVNSGEYKLMGLAPYGDPTSPKIKEYKSLIKKHIVDIKEDGSLYLHQKYFDYCVGLKMIKEKEWENLFGFNVRDADQELEQYHCDLALAIQQITNEIVLKMARTAKKLTNSDNLCLAGGVALNCVSTSKILRENVFENIWIQPAAGDAGGALGAALAVYHMYYEKTRKINPEDAMKGAYLGPEFSDDDIRQTANKFKAQYKYLENHNEIAELLVGGNVIGWFQGRMEFGPRALGNRSILGDARSSEMQKKLNLKIKFREGFRPFAPSVLKEDVREYFDIEVESPYMLLVADVLESHRKKLPENFYQMPVREKLKVQKSDLPAITHMDYSARLQTVDKKTNPKYWELINTFKQKTGSSVIVNTSFNIRGEPIVCTPDEAYLCFAKTDMDYLVMGNFLFDKKSQPAFEKYDMIDTRGTD